MAPIIQAISAALTIYSFYEIFKSKIKNQKKRKKDEFQSKYTQSRQNERCR